MTAHGLIDEFPRIEQMLRLEMFRRPTAAFLELDAEEVAGIAKGAMADCTDEFSVAVVHPNRSPGGHGVLGLKTYAAEGDIFEIGHPPLLSPTLVLPNHFHQFRAQHSQIRSPFLHAYLIGCETWGAESLC